MTPTELQLQADALQRSRRRRRRRALRAEDPQGETPPEVVPPRVTTFAAIKANAAAALAAVRASEALPSPPFAYGPGNNASAATYGWTRYGTNLQLSDMHQASAEAFNLEIQGDAAVGGYVGPSLNGLPYVAFASDAGYAALFTDEWLDAHP